VNQVGQTIVFRGLLGWAFRPRNFMKNQRLWGRQSCLRTRFQRVQPPAGRPGFSTHVNQTCTSRLRVHLLEVSLLSGDPTVGQTIAFCRLLGWAFRPRNFMKNSMPWVGHALACHPSEARTGFSTLSTNLHLTQASRARTSSLGFLRSLRNPTQRVKAAFHLLLGFLRVFLRVSGPPRRNPCSRGFPSH